MALRELVRFCFDLNYRHGVVIEHHLRLARHLIFSSHQRFRGYIELQEAEDLLEKLPFPNFALEERAEKLSHLYAQAFARELQRGGYRPWEIEQEVANYFPRKF